GRAGLHAEPRGFAHRPTADSQWDVLVEAKRALPRFERRPAGLRDYAGRSPQGSRLPHLLRRQVAPGTPAAILADATWLRAVLRPAIQQRHAETGVAVDVGREDHRNRAGPAAAHAALHDRSR